MVSQFPCDCIMSIRDPMVYLFGPGASSCPVSIICAATIRTQFKSLDA